MINSKSSHVDDRYKKVFTKKFNRFKKSIPLYIEFSIAGNILVITDLKNRDTIYRFTISDSMLEQQLIYEVDKYFIKNNIYPSIYNKEEDITYTIVKVKINKNEVILEENTTGRRTLYKMKLPVVLFLKNCNSIEDKNQVFQAFKNTSEMIKDLGVRNDN